MNVAKCPQCLRVEAKRIPDAAHKLRDGALKPIAGWFCEWCCVSWIKDGVESRAKRAANKAKYAKKKVTDETRN